MEIQCCAWLQSLRQKTEVATFSKEKAEQLASEGPGLSRLALPLSQQELTEAAEEVVHFNTKKNNFWAEWMLNA